MKKLKSIVALSLTFSVLMSCLFSAVATSSVEDVLTAEEKITSELKEQYALADGDEVIAQVWFSDIDISSAEAVALKSTGMTKAKLESYEVADPLAASDQVLAEQDDEIQAYIEAKRAAARELYTDYNQKLADELLSGTEVFYISRYSPVVLAKLSENSAMTIAEHPKIQMISYYSNDVISEDLTRASSPSISINDVNTITRVNSVHESSNYGYTGQGVKIGVLDIGIPNTSQFSNLNIKKILTVGTVSEPDVHAATILDIVSSVAPDAEYYLASDQYTIYDMQTIEMLLDYGVNIINASRTIGELEDTCQYGEIEKWLDHIAYQHDVHLVQASGNKGGGSVAGVGTGPSPGAMAYNIVTVGNLDTKGTPRYSDDVIASNSSCYTGSTLAYKPDICAPGSNIYSRFYQDAVSGTSLAAPQVSGVIALMCEQRPALKTQQTAVKAILTAGVNFDSPHRYTPSNANYKKYGAGLLDCVGACYVAGNYRYTNSSIASGTTSKTHTFTVNSSDSRIRVSLAFNVKSSGSGTDHGTITTGSKLDLNIQVKDPSGRVVGSSTTKNNNVEIVDFVPTTTGKYSVVVSRADTSAETVYYGLAWR